MPIKVVDAPKPNILVIHDNSTVAIDAGATVNLSVVQNDVRVQVNVGSTKIITVAEQGPRGIQGVPGPQGQTITNSTIDANGHLIITLNDGTVYDAGLATGPQGVPGQQGADGTSSGGIFVTDVTPTSSGNVGAKVWNTTTIPSNIVVEEVTSDVANVRVHVIVIGASANYTPAATVDGIPVTNLVEDATTKRYYTGYVDIVVNSDRVVTVDNLDGGNDNVLIKRAAAGPQITSFTYGALPNGQTELKAGDVLNVSGVVENSATIFNVNSFGAHDGVTSLNLGVADSGGVGYKAVSGTVTINSNVGVTQLQATAYNSLGTAGNTVLSADITLNQTYPTLTLNSITYPIGQQALKNSESADVDVLVTNFDTIQYTSSNCSIASPSTYSQIKTLTRTSGTYVNSGYNYHITATKTSNGASTTLDVLVSIANVAPTASITIDGNPTSLMSSPTGVDYNVIVTPNQALLSEPSLVSDKGTWLGVWNNNSRLLRIDDAVQKGLGTFSSLQIVGLSGLIGTTITSGDTFVVGGFQTRTITFPAFSQIAPIGTSVHNINNTRANYTGGSTLTLQTSTADIFQGYTIVDANGIYNINGDYLWINDVAFAGANTTGTLQVDIVELVI